MPRRPTGSGRFGCVGLRVLEEGGQLGKVDAVIAVVLEPAPAAPADAAVSRAGVVHGVRSRGSHGCPVRAVQIRRSRPCSVVSVGMLLGPNGHLQRLALPNRGNFAFLISPACRRTRTQALATKTTMPIRRFARFLLMPQALVGRHENLVPVPLGKIEHLAVALVRPPSLGQRVNRVFR